MKKIKVSFIFMLSAVVALFASCVEDTTTNATKVINEVTFDGMESSYTVISNIDVLEIDPVIKGSIYGEDESKYRFMWTMDGAGAGSASKIQNIHISDEKKLTLPITFDPQTYNLILRVYDKDNGMEYEKSVTLRVVSPFVRGYYLYGEKEDGYAGCDFVSFVAGRDTAIIRDIFKDEVKVKKPTNLLFAGYDGTGGTDPFKMTLWAVGEENTLGLESSPVLQKFGVISQAEPSKMLYPSIAVTEPMQIIDVHPHAQMSNSNTLLARGRMLLTKNEIFVGNFYTGPEMYGNPINRYGTNATYKLFKPSPYVFYKGNALSASSTYYMMVYDMDSHCFVCPYSMFYSATYCRKIATDTNTSTTFFWDQTKYSPVRELIYGQNSYVNNGRSYALLNDENGDFYVYTFVVSTYLAPTKERGYTIKSGVATDIDKASNFTFFTQQAYLLYSVGSKLYVVDYAKGKCEMVKDFGDEITYLQVDRSSYNRNNEFRVCTYSKENKGVVYQYFIDDDVNNINVTKGDDEWHTDLRVVKFEYRNSSYGRIEQQ